MQMYGVLIVTLQQQESMTNPEVKGIANFMATPKFVLMCGFLLDILKLMEPLNRLCCNKTTLKCHN